MLRLEELDERHTAAILHIAEEVQEGESGFGGFGVVNASNVSEVLRALNDMAAGKNLPEGLVPQTTFLGFYHDTPVGVVRVRHCLTPRLLHDGGHIGYYVRREFRNRGFGTALLRLALDKAARMGIAKVLLTVDECNPSSIRVIEKCGGVLEDTRQDEEGIPHRRYWIHVS